MIIYGWRSSSLKTEVPPSFTCPQCGEQGSTHIEVYSSYFHIFWIPVFPYSKKIGSQCASCNYAIDKSNAPEQLDQLFKQMKAQVRLPVWQFAGLILVALAILYGVFSSYQNEQELQSYLANPQVGDRYVVDADLGYYSTLIVANLSEDSIYFKVNEYMTSELTGIDEIDVSENYSDTLVSVHRSSIEQMYIEEQLHAIDR